MARAYPRRAVLPVGRQRQLLQSPGKLELLARQEAQLLAIHGVTSVGIGLGLAGGEALVVGVVDAGVAARLPSEIEGVPLVVQVTGPVDALRQR